MSRHRSLLIIGLIAQLAWAAPAQAFNLFECVRDLMPITEHANLQAKRSGVEGPMLVDKKYLVFPEVIKGEVTGFYFYGREGGKYYDLVEASGKTVAVRDLKFRMSAGIYDLVAQPSGLETVVVPYLPGFHYSVGKGGGPVVLGSSVLPVVGAFVSRPSLRTLKYLNPDEANKTDVQAWAASQMGDRRPASIDKIELKRTLAHLRAKANKKTQDLYRPLENEFKLRKGWIQTHNLDEKTFKQFTLILEGSCKQ